MNVFNKVELNIDTYVHLKKAQSFPKPVSIVFSKRYLNRGNYCNSWNYFQQRINPQLALQLLFSGSRTMYLRLGQSKLQCASMVKKEPVQHRGSLMYLIYQLHQAVDSQEENDGISADLCLKSEGRGKCHLSVVNFI